MLPASMAGDRSFEQGQILAKAGAFLACHHDDICRFSRSSGTGTVFDTKIKMQIAEGYDIKKRPARSWPEVGG